MSTVTDQLRLVGELQHQILPRQLPQPPGWRIAVYYSLGQMPGGDYYDLLPLPDGRLVLLVADACGHDALSAVMVVTARVILHSCPLISGRTRFSFCPLNHTQPPNVILNHLNRLLYENTLEEQFMTAFLAELTPHHGRLVFANAGHPPPLCWRSSTGIIETVPDVAALPLGIEENTIYPTGEFSIQDGDILVCYSDGLVEVQNLHNEQFGQARLLDALRESAPSGADAVKESLLMHLHSFQGGIPPHDDITMLILERLPNH